MRLMILAVVLLLSGLAFAGEAPDAGSATPTVATARVVANTPATPVVVATTPPAASVVEPKVAAKPTSSLDTNGDGKVDAAEQAAATAKEATVADVIKDGADTVNAAKALKDPTMPKGVMVAVLLGAVFKLLLSLMKVLGKNIAWFKTANGKRIVKYSTLGLGAAAGLVANLAFGMSWIDSVTILLSGPIAVAINEYTSDSKSTPTDPPSGPIVDPTKV